MSLKYFIDDINNKKLVNQSYKIGNAYINLDFRKFQIKINRSIRSNE